MIIKSRPFVWLFLPVAVALYAYSVIKLDRIPRTKEKDLLTVALPAPVQVLLTGGDRFLAANLAVIRAIVVSTGDLDSLGYEMLAQIQSDAARLNPAHEDNYYISQAILPWNNQLEADMFIQARATEARPWDATPALFLGFDKYYFLRDPVGGAQSLQLAAAHLPPGNREALMGMAARWYEKGDDPRTAIGMIDTLAKGTRDKDLKKQLEERKQRMEGLAMLRDAAKLYGEKYGKPPGRLADLIGPGFLEKVPSDPLNQGYTLDANGVPVMRKPIASALPPPSS